MGRLSGKRAIVTGAGSGIGRASARLFAAEGAALVIVDKVEAAIDETAEMIRKDGGTAISVAADVSDETALQGFVELCAQQHGGVDVLFDAVGGEHGKHIAAERPTRAGEALEDLVVVADVQPQRLGD